MEIHPDFQEFLALLSNHHVDYAIVGGYALALHGAPRFTGDMDVLVATGKENAQRLLAALDEFGFGSLGLSVSDFEEEGRFVRLGHPPVRIDILTSISGVSWADVKASIVRGSYGSANACFIGREELISNKRAAGREKDLADVAALEGR